MEVSEIAAVVGRSDVAPAQGGPAKFVREIDEYLAQTFDMMTQIDESYGKVSSFFVKHANEVVGDREYEKLSEDEQTLAYAYMAAALAVSGACAVIKGVTETLMLEKVRRLHRKVAEAKYESLGRMIERAQRIHDDAAGVLASHNRSPFQAGEIRNNFREIANICEEELCQYRDARFRLDMLLWLKEEYEAWLDNRLYSDAPMPTMGQATLAAIYVLHGHQIPYSREKRDEDLKAFGQGLAESMELAGTANGKQFISSFELLAMIDSQMGAVLEHGYMDADPFVNAISGNAEDDDEPDVDLDKLSCKRLYATLYANSGDGTVVDKILSENPTTVDSSRSLRAFNTMNSEFEAGAHRILTSGCMLVAAAVLPIWQLDWSWYWLLALSLLVGILVWKFFPGKSIKRMQDNLILKFDMMSNNYRYLMAKRAGLIEPKSKIKEMVRSRNSFWGGLFIGAILGTIVGGPIGLVGGAILGAIIGSDSSEEVDPHGHGWQKIKICSPAKQWITIVIAALLLLFEIYVIFII